MTMRILISALAVTVAGIVAPAGATNSPVFGYVPARSGFNTAEHTLNAHNVGRLRAKWQINLGSVADSTPILLDRVIIRGVARVMLFQTASDGVTYGIDARTGKVLWRYATHGPKITQSTPAADPSGTAIYVPGIDGFIRKLDAATGRELHAPGFPARLTLITYTEKDASALNVANGYLYATTSGYNGDAPPYDGHVLSVRLSDGATHVFNSLCSTDRSLPTATSCPQSDSGIWARGGAVVDPDPAMQGEVFAATGNGDFDANSGGHNYGDSLLGLNHDVTKLLGNYTPKDYTRLDNYDIDMGSTSPALLPREPRSRTPLMIVQGGKDETLRLVDRANLPGVGGELQRITIAGPLYATPAVWTDASNRTWIFFGLSQEIDAFRLETDARGKSRLVGIWRSTAGQTSGEGTSPVVANGLVFVAMDNALLALDATTGHLMWSSAQHSAVHTIGPVHWESPIVVDGWVYCSDQNGDLTAYGLP